MFLRPEGLIIAAYETANHYLSPGGCELRVARDEPLRAGLSLALPLRRNAARFTGNPIAFCNYIGRPVRLLHFLIFNIFY